MKVIAVEEHVTSPLYQSKITPTPRRLASLADSSERVGHDVMAEMLDIGKSRIAAMDETGIDLQLLSLTMPGPQGLPADEAITVATDANDLMAAACKAYPGRFAALAALPTPDVAASVKELQRTVRTLGFKGTMINGHTNGEFLDDKKYWPIFEAAQALDVPVYLHPRDPHPLAAQAYFQGYQELSTAGWGFTMDTVSHILRLIFSGVFDTFPKLQLVIGHLGEGIPFFLERLDHHTCRAMKRRGLKKTVVEYMRDNVTVTTSGNFSIAALQCTIAVLGIDKVIFSIDWPYESNREGMDFFRHLPLGPGDMAKLAHGNAERVFKL